MNEILDEEIGNSDQIKKVNRVFSSLLFGLMTIHMIGEIIGISIPTPPRLIQLAVILNLGYQLAFLFLSKGKDLFNLVFLGIILFLVFYDLYQMSNYLSITQVATDLQIHLVLIAAVVAALSVYFWYKPTKEKS